MKAFRFKEKVNVLNHICLAIDFRALSLQGPNLLMSCTYSMRCIQMVPSLICGGNIDESEYIYFHCVSCLVFEIKHYCHYSSNDPRI